MDNETQTSLDTSVQVGTDTKFIIRRKIVITRHKSTQTSLEMSTQIVSARSKMINSYTQTKLDQSVQIDTVKEREKKLFFLSRKKPFNKRCRLVEVVDKWTETSLEQSVDIYREPKQDEIFHEKIISVNNYDSLGYRGKVNDFISITPVTSIYQNKKPKIRPGCNVMPESSNPFLNDTMKFYAKLTAERLNCISSVDKSSKNFYSTSFSMQPGFSFGKLPPKFPPKYEVPGPGSYDIHVMEYYMRHIPGPVYIESKPVHSPKPVVVKKDFQIPKATKKNSSNRKLKMKNVKPATYSNKQLKKYIVEGLFANKKQFGSGFNSSRDTQTKQLKSVTTSINHSKIELDNETYNKHRNFSKQSTIYKENDVYTKTAVSKISKTFQMPLKLDVKTSNTEESISKNKSVLNVGIKSNDNFLNKKLPENVPSAHPFTQETEHRPRPYETLDTKLVEMTGSSLLKTKLENKKILATNQKTIEMKIPSISKDTTSTIELYLKKSNKSIISGNKEMDSFKAYEAKFNLASDAKVADQTRNSLIKPKFIKSKEKLTMNNPKTVQVQIPSKSIDEISTTEVNLKNSNDITSEIKEIDRFKAYEAKFNLALDEKVAEQTRCSLIKPKSTVKEKILTMYNPKNVEVKIPSKSIDTSTIEVKLKNSNKSIMSGNEEIDSFEIYEAKFNVEPDLKVFKQTRRSLIKPKSIKTKKILTMNNPKTVEMNISSKSIDTTSTIEVKFKNSNKNIMSGNDEIDSFETYEAKFNVESVKKVFKQTRRPLIKPKSIETKKILTKNNPKTVEMNIPSKSTIEVNLKKSHNIFGSKKKESNNDYEATPSLNVKVAEQTPSSLMKPKSLNVKSNNFPYKLKSYGPVIKKKTNASISKKGKYSESKEKFDEAQLIDRYYMKHHNLQRGIGEINFLNSNYSINDPIIKNNIKVDTSQKNKYSESKTMIDKAELINRNMKLHHLQREGGKTNVLNSNYFSDNNMDELKMKFDSINIEAQKKKYTPIYLKGNWEI